jgi:uncharacterized protein (DUF1778 family)
MSDKAINIRAHANDVILIDRAAEIEGKTRSSFLRDCATEAARKVFERPRLFGEPCPFCGHPKSR